MENQQMETFICGLVCGWFLTECWVNLRTTIKKQENYKSFPKTQGQKDDEKKEFMGFAFILLVRFVQISILALMFFKMF